MLEEKLDLLKKKMIEYSGFVENMVKKSIDSLINKTDILAKQVIQEDEVKANDFEIEIDELCTTIIAQYSPKGVELRTVLMILKMNNDLERIADHAVNIAQSVLVLNQAINYQKLYTSVSEMFEIVWMMLKNSIDSFINNDPNLAKNVCTKDSDVDHIRNKNFATIIDLMKKDQIDIDIALHLRRIFSNLERIADLTTNICEEVIFIVEGRIIKHHKDII